MPTPSDLLNRDGDRRDFFRTTLGRVARDISEQTERRVVVERYFRPPGAVDEVSFLSLCTRCESCVEVCPPRAIVKAPPAAGLAAGTPRLEPSRQPCTVWTNGVNYDIDNKGVIKKIREWDARYGLDFIGADFDWFEAEFKTLPKNMKAFAKEVYEFCPDVVDQGSGSVEALAKEMKETKTLFLWWD